MNYKHFIYLIALVAISGKANAQNITLHYDDAYMQDFFNSTLKVCLVGDAKYDAAIKEAVQNNWTLTKFEFINNMDLKDKKIIQDKTSSFLVPLSLSDLGDPHLTPNLVYQWKMLNDNRWLSILPGGRKSILDYRDYNIIVYSPFDNFNLESNILLCSYRLGLMIKSMQDAIIISRDKKIKGAPFNVLRDVLSQINLKANVLKSKTLLVNENLLKNKNEKGKFAITEEILKTYKFKYKIVSQQEIETAIKSKDKESCYFCPVFSGGKDIYIYNLENMEVIYGTYEMKGTTVDNGDISKLNQAISSN